MAKYNLSRNISNEEVFSILKKGLKHPKLVNITKDKNGVTVVNTKWMKYTVASKGNQINVKPGWNSSKLPIIIALAISGLFLIIPLVVLIIISLSTMGEQKEMASAIYNSLISANSNKEVVVDATAQLEKLAELKTKGVITEVEFQEKKTKILANM